MISEGLKNEIEEFLEKGNNVLEARNLLRQVLEELEE